METRPNGWRYIASLSMAVLGTLLISYLAFIRDTPRLETITDLQQQIRTNRGLLDEIKREQDRRGGIVAQVSVLENRLSGLEKQVILLEVLRSSIQRLEDGQIRMEKRLQDVWDRMNRAFGTRTLPQE